MSLGDFAQKISRFATDNSPAILSGMAAVGTLTTAYLTGKATLKAADILRDESQHLESREKVALTWKMYMPPASAAVLTIVCIILANRVGTRRAAALAATYAISEKAFSEYKEKVIEKIGAPKEQVVRDEIAQDRVNRHPLSETVIIGEGSVLCHEAFTGRYFLSSMEELKKAQNDLNYRVLNDYYASLTDLYNLLGLPKTSMSDEVGWNSDQLLELNFSTTLSENGRPCLVVDYQAVPIRNFYRVN